MAESSTSLSSKDVSSAISLYDPSSNAELLDNLSTRAVYEMDPEDSISRPLSRGSVTSGVSMMATKDGVEGEKVKRLGIPQYSLNLLNSMAHSQYKKLHNYSHSHSHSHTSLTKNQGHANNTEEPGMNSRHHLYPDSPNSPPMTLREKMRLLNHDRHIPSGNNSNEMFEESSIYGSANSHNEMPSSNRNYGLYSNDNEMSFLNPNRNGGSDVDSNMSTVGDDASFSRNMRNLSPAIGIVEKDTGKK